MYWLAAVPYINAYGDLFNDVLDTSFMEFLDLSARGGFEDLFYFFSSNSCFIPS